VIRFNRSEMAEAKHFTFIGPFFYTLKVNVHPTSPFVFLLRITAVCEQINSGIMSYCGAKRLRNMVHIHLGLLTDWCSPWSTQTQS